MSIKDNIKKVMDEIADSAVKAGRNPETVKLITVTKTRTADEIKEALDTGIVHLGENRVQEASEKVYAVGGSPVWHLIGHLQSNKSKKAASLFHWIDSLDSEHSAKILSEEAFGSGKVLNVLIQIKISVEDSKSGIEPASAFEFAKKVSGYPGLKIKGLMTIGSLDASERQTRMEFAQMRELFENMKTDPILSGFMEELSMGMSGDFRIAIEEGSTMVRIGTAIFGDRYRL